MRTARTTVHRTLAVLLLAGLTTLLVGGPARADAYRYWGFYQWSGTEWAFAQTGPADTTPTDGTVEGWRFALADESSTRVPRATGDFDAICGSTPAADGSKRVAIVVDYGTPEDSAGGADAQAPPAARGDCAVVPTDATSQDALAEVATLRLGEGLVCAVDGYPSAGCGDAVEGPAPGGEEQPVELVLPAAATATAGPASGDSTGAEDDSDLPTIALVGAIAAVAVVGAAAYARTRRGSGGGTPTA